MSTKKIQILDSVLATDDTLTKSGVAADAKAVGDEITELNEKTLPSIPADKSNQQLVSDADGKAVWVERLAYSAPVYLVKDVELTDTGVIEEEGVTTFINLTPLLSDFEEGKTYTVIYNGVAYVCPVVMSENLYLLGNVAMAGIEGGAEYPFLYGFSQYMIEESNIYGACYALDGAASVTISIYIADGKIVKLPQEYYDNSDWNASYGEPGHVLNRTHYEKNFNETIVFDPSKIDQYPKLISANGEIIGYKIIDIKLSSVDLKESSGDETIALHIGGSAETGATSFVHFKNPIDVTNQLTYTSLSSGVVSDPDLGYLYSFDYAGDYRDNGNIFSVLIPETGTYIYFNEPQYAEIKLRTVRKWLSPKMGGLPDIRGEKDDHYIRWDIPNQTWRDITRKELCRELGVDVLTEKISAHQQLVSDQDGNISWEDRLAYTQTTKVDLLPETLLTYSGEEGVHLLLSPLSSTLKQGETYDVIYNGVNYSYPALYTPDESNIGYFILGNSDAIGMGAENADAPFAIIILEDASVVNFGYYALCVALDNATSVTMTISGDATVYKTIDEKYLPTESVRKTVTLTIGEDNSVTSDVDFAMAWNMGLTALRDGLVITMPSGITHNYVPFYVTAIDVNKIEYSISDVPCREINIKYREPSDDLSDWGIGEPERVITWGLHGIQPVLALNSYQIPMAQRIENGNMDDYGQYVKVRSSNRLGYADADEILYDLGFMTVHVEVDSSGNLTTNAVFSKVKEALIAGKYVRMRVGSVLLQCASIFDTSTSEYDSVYFYAIRGTTYHSIVYKPDGTLVYTLKEL